MGSKWTDKQLDAITARNSAVLVSAAAGSGKTSVLVERLIRQLSDTENKIPADRMVIVTFTKDAAAQMKQRLSLALSDAVSADPNNTWLCKQQALIQTAKISTIHSFCFDLIRENVQSLDVSAGFRILDDTEITAIITSAVDNVFERLYDENADLMNKLGDFFSKDKREDIKLESNVLALYEFLMSIPYYEDWLALQYENAVAGFDCKNNPLVPLYLSELERAYKKCLRYAEYAVTMCEDIYIPADSKSKSSKGRNDKAMLVLQNEYEFFLSLSEELKKEFNSWDERIGTSVYKFDRLTFSRELDENEKEVSEIIKGYRNTYKELYGNAVKSLFTLDYINNDYAVTAEILDGLIMIIRLLDTEISRLKAEKNGLSFSDAEQLAIRLLSRKNEDGTIERTPLAAELSEYYKIIMIDEFQDANNTQDMIFKLISHNGSPYKMGDNVFVVGDVKQSIYHFRLANPKLFIGALDGADMYPDVHGENAAKILLNKNFRSSRDVVDFSNYVFENLMSKQVGDILYGEDEKLVMGAAFPDNDTAGNKIDRTTEILLVKPVSTEDENESEVENETEDGADEKAITKSDNAEANAVAKKIASMVGVTEVYENGALRKSRYSDFCILLRGNAAQQLYADALAEYGIKAITNKPVGYLKSREIAVLISLLSVIDNPLQDIHLCTVLMSPMFMLDANDMAKLRLLTETPKSPLFPCIRKIVRDDEDCPLDKNDVLYTKLAAFMDIYDMLRINAASQSLDRLIRSIYDSTDFLSAVQVYRDGEQKKANLRLLLEYAKAYEQNSAGGLSGFMRYIYAMAERGSDFSIASTVSASENAVFIKTIHSSKGLEFPYVFICDTAKAFNLKNSDKSGYALATHFNLAYGIGFKISDHEKKKSYDSFQQSMIRKINENEAVSEEMRLLYVALTRAKEKLFISIVDDDKTERRIEAVSAEISFEGHVNENVASSAKSMLDWLLMVLITHPTFNDVMELTDVHCNECDVPIKVTMVDGKITDMQKSTAVKASADINQVIMLKKWFDYAYDDTLTQTAAKLTISEIAKSEAEDEIYLKRPDFVSDNNGLSAAEIGTAMHTFMQYADFIVAERDTHSEGDRLTEYGIITPSERDSLRYVKLDMFFKSDLYSRIKNAQKIYREKKFLVEISELALDDELGMEYNNTSGMLQGIADCFFLEGNEFVLLDYKTDRVSSSAVLISRYERQLKLYSKALEKIYGIPVKEAYIYSFGLDKEVPILL